MKKLRQIPVKQKKFSKSFTTTKKYNADRGENSRLNENKKLFEINQEIKTSSSLANEKSLHSDQLLDLLKKNKQESTDNCYSADLSIIEVKKVCGKAVALYSEHRDTLTQEKQQEIDLALVLKGPLHTYPKHDTEEEKSLYDIEKSSKQLIDAIYKAKSLQEVVKNPGKVNEIVGESEKLLKEINTLSHNITTLTNNNDRIRAELTNRNVSLTEDILNAYIDIPGYGSDNSD